MRKMITLQANITNFVNISVVWRKSRNFAILTKSIETNFQKIRQD